MKIEKDFDTFSSIVLDEEKREILYKGPKDVLIISLDKSLG